MAKKASDSTNSGSSPTSTASAKNSSTPSNQKMVLRVRSSDRMKRSAQESFVSEREQRSKSKSNSRTKSKQKKKITRIDAKMPKKPPTAFFFFLQDYRKEFQEQNPDIKSMRDIGKACGEKWKIMTYEEKVKYYDIATERRAEFDKAMAEYIRRKESGEDLETEDEDDSEFDE